MMPPTLEKPISRGPERSLKLREASSDRPEATHSSEHSEADHEAEKTWTKLSKRARWQLSEGASHSPPPFFQAAKGATHLGGRKTRTNLASQK